MAGEQRVAMVEAAVSNTRMKLGKVSASVPSKSKMMSLRGRGNT
ncbi:MAG: hypothetical protein ABIQ08_08895 [Duganella sp.]